MGVQLNIKDAETVRLARELADARGQSVTAVIRAALEREALEHRIAVQAKLAQVRDISRRFRGTMPCEWQTMTSAEIMDDIYDEGLPR